MEEKRIEIRFEILEKEELLRDDLLLYAMAHHAARQAYAPYSRFQVGAAALVAGMTVEGSNQENRAYPSGMCAERVALFFAGAHHPERPVTALAIIALKKGIIQPPVAPCGACCQVLLEMEQRHGKPIRVLMCGSDHVIAVSSAKDLLPFSFSGML
ncbi:MAG: cytidine deaminase [Tannerella sp.]|nr:cytidine deaminase [Tannerella sp.]